MIVGTAKRWDRATYYRLAEEGFLEGRVELVDGAILEMSPQNPPHASAVGRLTNMLVKIYGDTHMVRVQLPLDLGAWDQPEPDLAIVPWSQVDKSTHPRNADLVIEVADSSLAFDLKTKRDLYLRSGITNYWVVDLPRQGLAVWTDQGWQTYSQDQSLLLPGTDQDLEICSIFE